MYKFAHLLIVAAAGVLGGTLVVSFAVSMVGLWVGRTGTWLIAEILPLWLNKIWVSAGLCALVVVVILYPLMLLDGVRRGAEFRPRRARQGGWSCS